MVKVAIVLVASSLALAVQGAIDAASLTKAREVLAKMTFAEKAALCEGSGKLRLTMSELQPTLLPSQLAVSTTWNLELAQTYAHTLGDIALEKDCNVLLGPRIELSSDSTESFGEDPHLASRFAFSWVRALQSHDVAACVESFGFDPVVVGDARAFNEAHLAPWRAALRNADAYTAMRGNAPQHIINSIIRERWGFAGIVVNEREIYAEDGYDEPALRILYTMARLKFFEDTPTNTTTVAATSTSGTGTLGAEDETGSASARRLDAALRIAQEAAVLLKNDRSILPLDSASATNLLFVGIPPEPESVDDQEESGTKPEPTLVSPQRAVRNFFEDEETSVKIATLAHDASGEELVAAAHFADATLVFCASRDGRGANRSISELTSRGATNLVLMLNSPITLDDMPAATNCAAILYLPHLGDLRSRVLASILFGETSPSGKLASTWPKSSKDAPPQDAGIYTGYKWFDKTKTLPLFPFGHGLAYTKFDYDMEKAEVVRFADDVGWDVSIPVKNIGSASGKEIVQIYTAYPNAKAWRPLKELKGFAKTKLLAPGESETLTIRIAPRDLAYWDTFTNRFRLDEGECQVLVGASAQDIRGKAKITVTKDHVFQD